jgi:hypothetical protein
VDPGTDSREQLTSGQGARRARCPERGTPGSAGGPGKPTGSNPGRAPRSDPTLLPRSKGGRTSLTNMLLLCTFHHLIAVHRWGWGIVLHPDGTTTATSPDGQRTLHSHGPPARAA